MDFAVIIPGEYADLTSQLEGNLAARISYWDPGYHSVQHTLNDWAALVNKLRQFHSYIEEYIHQVGSRDILVDILETARWPLGSCESWMS